MANQNSLDDFTTYWYNLYPELRVGSDESEPDLNRNPVSYASPGSAIEYSSNGHHYRPAQECHTIELPDRCSADPSLIERVETPEQQEMRNGLDMPTSNEAGTTRWQPDPKSPVQAFTTQDVTSYTSPQSMGEGRQFRDSEYTTTLSDLCGPLSNDLASGIDENATRDAELTTAPRHSSQVSIADAKDHTGAMSLQTPVSCSKISVSQGCSLPSGMQSDVQTQGSATEEVSFDPNAWARDLHKDLIRKFCRYLDTFEERVSTYEQISISERTVSTELRTISRITSDPSARKQCLGRLRYWYIMRKLEGEIWWHPLLELPESTESILRRNLRRLPRQNLKELEMNWQICEPCFLERAELLPSYASTRLPTCYCTCTRAQQLGQG